MLLCEAGVPKPAELGEATKVYQIHWHHKDGVTDLKMQREINSHDEMRKFVSDAWEECPPPEGDVFLVVSEESKYFAGTTA